MTVQTPQEPGHFYPDAPPWAASPHEQPVTEQAAQPFGGVVPPYGSPDNKHGQLLVRFPGEVLGSARPDAPSWRPVVVWTFFLSVLGVIAAMRRSGRARRYGRNRTPYWVAFGVTLVAGAAFWSVLAVDVAIPAYLSHRESVLTEAVQRDLLSDGRVEAAAGAEVSSAQCAAEDDRDSGGTRTYLCTLLLAEGGTSTVTVEADESAAWTLLD